MKGFTNNKGFLLLDRRGRSHTAISFFAPIVLTPALAQANTMFCIVCDAKLNTIGCCDHEARTRTNGGAAIIRHRCPALQPAYFPKLVFMARAPLKCLLGLGIAIACRRAQSESVFHVRDYGARGDAKTLDTVALNRTIAACAD